MKNFNNRKVSGVENKMLSTEKLKMLTVFSTHTAGLYGAGAGLGVVGVDWGCLSSVAELHGLTPGVHGEIGVVGSTWKNDGQPLLDDAQLPTIPCTPLTDLTVHSTNQKTITGPGVCSSYLRSFEAIRCRPLFL